MTTLGLIFSVVFVVAILRGGLDGLLLAVSAAIPFNDSAMIAHGSFALPPFYMGAMLYLAATVMARVTLMNGAWWPKTVLVFWAYAGVVTIFAPHYFSDLGVVKPGLGLDAQASTLSPLVWSSSNLAQLAYLTVNVALIVTLVRSSRSLGAKHLATGFGIGVLVAFAAVVMPGRFPYALFQNSTRSTYGLALQRSQAQFSEPSHLGAFALTAMLFFALYAVRLKGVRRLAVLLLAIMAAVEVVASASGTAIAGLVVAGTALTAWVAVYLLRGGTFSPWAAIAACPAAVVAVFYAPRGWSFATRVVEGKNGSRSLADRTAANGTAWSLTKASHFLGVGLGSNRASSLLLLLLSTVGIIGTLLFVSVSLRALQGLIRDHQLATGCALLGYIAASFISLADFSSPILWSMLAAGLVLPSVTAPDSTSGAHSRSDSKGKSSPAELSQASPRP